jgi:hypothetical protein
LCWGVLNHVPEPIKSFPKIASQVEKKGHNDKWYFEYRYEEFLFSIFIEYAIDFIDIWFQLFV